MNDEFYISLIGEVFDGYTEIEFLNQPVYVKHFSIRDQRYIHKYYEKYKALAINRGVESEESILRRLKQDEIWTDSDDLKIESLRLEIKNLESTQKSLFIPSHKEKMQQSINEKKFELFSLDSKRKEIVGKTAEDYASSRANQEMIRYFLYKDPDLQEPVFTSDEFDELEDKSIIILNQKQLEINQRLSESNLQKAVLRPFFSIYISQCENISDFYGKAIVDLSVYQMKTALLARMFFNIFQYTDNIPDNIREDPEKLVAFSDAQKNKDKNKKFIKDDSDASAVFGATKQDMEYLSSSSNSKNVSLSDELKKSGGKLNMEQMIKLAGH